MTTERSPAVRWTPRRIQKALLCPKPMGARVRAMAFDYGPSPTIRLEPKDVRALRHIAEHADLLPGTTGVPYNEFGAKAAAWLILPAPVWLLEALATFDAASADLEPDDDREPDDPPELNGDDEPDLDDEPGADEGACDGVSP